jgi:hypothetical protein
MSSADNRMHVYDSSNQLWRRAEGSTTGILKCETTLDKTGLATDTLQTSGNASLTNMDSKIVACNTGAVVISSGSVTETNSAGILADTTVIAGDTTSLDAKIVACNTGAVVISSGSVTETNSAGILADTNSLDLKITTCDTGNVIISSGSVTESNSAAISSSISSMDGKMSSGSDASLVNAQQMVVYGRDSSGGLDALKVDQQGHLEVIMDGASNKGSHENLAANVTINAGAYSSVVNINDMNVGNLFYEDSSTSSFDTLNIEVSIDGTNYFKYTELYPNDDGSGVRTTKETGMQLQGLKNLRLYNKSALDNYSNVKASVVGSP